MPTYPLPPYPAGLNAEQYTLLWNVVCQRKILLVGHLSAQGDLITGLLTLGYLDATPTRTTPEARARCQASIEHCYDQLAAIPRNEWPVRHENAKRLLDTADARRRDLIESTYDVSEAGRRLVLAWEAPRTQAQMDRLEASLRTTRGA